MKVFISLDPPSNNIAYGGGLFFVKNLRDFLIKNNHSVVYNIEHNDIDIILIIDPRNGPMKKYKYIDLLKYRLVNPNVKIVYRVNECDIKRYPQSNLEPMIIDCINKCDYVVFVSKWLKDYYCDKYNINKANITHILPGCNSDFFNPINRNKKRDKIKLVTHHWSNNYNKGFEIYNCLDKLLDLEAYSNIEFTYIGNYIENYKPKNIKVIDPRIGDELARIIKQNNIYLTASQYEPGGNHNIEGVCCGLPILYRENGGSIKEQSIGIGEEYSDINNLLEKIELINTNYEDYVTNIDFDKFNSDRCSQDYLNFFQDIFQKYIKKETII
jgi:hypothetical protein